MTIQLRLLPLALVALGSCSLQPPALQSPLRDELAAADSASIESATRDCLAHAGWKVDPIGGVAGGANLVTGYKAKQQTTVYVYPPPTSPRITGGPDEDAFWDCLGGALGAGRKKK